MHAGVSVLCRVGRGTDWRSGGVDTRKLFYIKCMSSVRLEESLDTYIQIVCSQKFQTRLSLSQLDLVPMPAELDIEKVAGSDLSSAATGSTLAPSHVNGSERRSSVSTRAGSGEGKCHLVLLFALLQGL